MPVCHFLVTDALYQEFFRTRESSNVGGFRALFLRVRKGAEDALINIHTNEGALINIHTNEGELINIHTNEGEVINIHTMRVREGEVWRSVDGN